MDLLHELVYVVELSPSRSFSLLLPEGSKIRGLYDRVAENEFLTDEQAAEDLYQCAPSDKRYLMLKRNLISKLSELILISELGDPETTSIKFNLEQRLTVADKLLLQNVYHNAEKIGKKVRREAQKAFLTDVHLRALLLLRKVYTLKGDAKAYAHFAAEYSQVQQQARQEDRWLHCVQEVESGIKYTVATLPQVADSIAWPKAESDTRGLSRLGQYYHAKLSIYSARHRYVLAELEAPLHRLEKLIQEHAALQTPANQLFWLTHRIQYGLAMGRVSSVMPLMQRAREESGFQSFDRFEVEELWYLYHTRQQQWTEAAQVVERVMETPQYDRLHVLDQNLWYVRGAYLYWCLCIQPGDVSLGSLQSRYANFSLDELYRQTAAISKDKTGGNLHVMLLRGLFTLLRPEASDHAFDTGNTLVVYFQRYLKDLPEERTALFFKSVAKLLKRREDPEKVQRLEEKMREGLEASPVKYDYNEWLPFEVIWNEWVLPLYLPRKAKA